MCQRSYGKSVWKALSWIIGRLSARSSKTAHKPGVDLPAINTPFRVLPNAGLDITWSARTRVFKCMSSEFCFTKDSSSPRISKCTWLECLLRNRRRMRQRCRISIRYDSTANTPVCSLADIFEERKKSNEHKEGILPFREESSIPDSVKAVSSQKSGAEKARSLFKTCSKMTREQIRNIQKK